MNKIACTHPGKLGDALYALPTIKKACQMYNATADFYTSEYCRPLKRLFEYQSFIDDVYIPDYYKVERMDMGAQPWRIPVDIGEYRMTYHLGFRRVPDKSIPDFICESVGLPLPVKVEYEYPDFETLNEPYIIVAPRGNTSYEPLFKEFINICSYKCVIVGGEGDYIGVGEDKTGLDILETTTWIAKASGFVGMMSAMLVLANGFNFPKVAPHDGIHWDMRHVIYSDDNFYPVNPTAENIRKLLKTRER